jgi:alpha-D-xyloside xylohydrolase
MKFTDGRWLLRDGVRVLHPEQAYRIDRTADSLTVLAPTRRVDERQDVLDQAALTVECNSPLADVIRVKLTHHAGSASRGPNFVLPGVTPNSAPAVQVVTDESSACLTSGRLTIRFARTGPWRVEFLAEGEPLTCSDSKSMGIAVLDGRTYLVDQLSLDVGERVYGLGERFGAFVKNGQSIEIDNKDAGTETEQAYKNVPFYLTSRGYGVFVNEPGPVSFEVASERTGSVQFSLEGETLEYMVIYGPSPKEVLEKYTALTGRPALPPAWSFGLWLSTSFTTSYDEKSVGEAVDGMIDREIPLSVFHFDTFWMREFSWCDFHWDERTFPDPAGMLRRLHQRGVRVSVWINPYVAQASRLFAEAAAAGYLIRKPNGDVWQTDQWVAGMGIVDFTNPDARLWYTGKLGALLDQGVDCFKTDFGERIPTDVVWHDGSDPVRMHNYYPYIYNKTVFDLLRERRGEGEAVLFARSATAGCQQFPVHWGGDCESTFESMADSLRGGLSLSLSGFGFWSHDIGGFEGTPPPLLYHRWSAFGLLSSHSRLHGSNSSRVPWLIDDKSVDIVSALARLKCRLMPYLYGAATEAPARGTPLMRAMFLEFPDDPTAGFLDRQYMLGPSLLVAPVFTEDGTVEHYIPAGKWTHLITGRVVKGPTWLRERYDVSSLPLFVRPGSVIPMSSQEIRADYDYADGVILRAYEIPDGARVQVDIPDLTGATQASFEVTRKGHTLSAERTVGSKPWQLLLVNVAAAKATELSGGSAQTTPDGLLVTPAAGASRLEVVLG